MPNDLWHVGCRRIMKVDSADEFYSLMGELSSDMMEGTIFNSDDIIKVTGHDIIKLTKLPTVLRMTAERQLLMQTTLSFTGSALMLN